jgi:hypothetical protein
VYTGWQIQVKIKKIFMVLEERKIVMDQGSTVNGPPGRMGFNPASGEDSTFSDIDAYGRVVHLSQWLGKK